MISQAELLETYESVELVAEDVFFFQDEMQAYTYSYWLKPSLKQDLIVVSQDGANDALALDVINSVATNILDPGAPVICELKASMTEFTHAIAVPCNYHGYLKGAKGVDRKNLYLCLPIHRCEFSGSESEDDFREMRFHYVPVLDWNRKAHPKLLVYFDNPKTGGGTDEAGAFHQWPELLQEISELNGVNNGFIEITNYQERVMEVLSPAQDSFILIRNRKDEEYLEFPLLVEALNRFAFGE